MKHNLNILSIFGALALMSAASCTRELYEPEETFELQQEERVAVNLSIRIEALEAGTPETKTIQEPEEPGVTSDSQIANILVLQFDGVTSDAQLVSQAYFPHWPLTVNEKVTLVALSEPSTVVVLANTFVDLENNGALGGITNNTTLGFFLQNVYTTINDLSELFTTKDGDDYIRMSGSKYMATVTAGSSVDVTLKRNVAKIVVNVTNNSTGDDAVSLEKAHLRVINKKYYYLTHIASELTAADPMLAFTDPYSSAYPLRFDNVQEDITGSTQTFTYYVPANMRGTTTNTLQYNKGNGAPAGATRFCLYGSYGANNTPIIYTYYLGENLTNDFNIRPNYKYTYNITINTKGDARYDYRIEEMGEVKFATDANCYMLHPPELSGQSRIYAIPVRRAAVFWNLPDTNLGVYGASSMEGYTTYVMDGSTAWTAEVLWSDFDMTPYPDFLQIASGTGFDPQNPAHSQPYFKVKIVAGMKGNVVVAMKVNGIILWSWHLWITEYDPDKHVVPEEHKYIYGVREGNIHRYNNTLWSKDATNSATGYANGFAMDRYLGASIIAYNDPGGRGLFYQFGRKDPFIETNQNNTSNHFYLGGTTDAFCIGTGDDESRRIAMNNTGVPDNKNVRYSVMNPMTFITGTNWTSAADDLADGGSTSFLWNDRKISNHQYGNQAILEIKKSIYDPCPPGWKLPISGCYSGFEIMPDAGNTEAGTYRSSWRDNNRCYYPEGYVNKETTGEILFPQSYHRDVSTGRISTNTHFLWHSSPSSSTTGTTFFFISSNVIVSYAYNRGYGMKVRCVRE